MNSQPSNCYSECILIVFLLVVTPTVYARNNIWSIKVIVALDSFKTSGDSQSFSSNIKKRFYVPATEKEFYKFSSHGVSRHPSLKFSLGFGFPELIYTGVQGYRNTYQVGTGKGTLPGYNHSIFAAFMHVGYHFWREGAI